MSRAFTGSLIVVAICGVAVATAAGLGIGPAPPAEVEISTAEGGLQLEWAPSEGADVAGYLVYRSVVSTQRDPAERLTELPISRTHFFDGGLPPGAFYCYTVRAVDSDGFEGQDSSEVCASFSPNEIGFFKRGDADGSGQLNIADPIVTLSHLFAGGVVPECLDAVDFNDSGDIAIDDAIASLSFLFVGSEPPPSPGPFFCGFDTTPDVVELGCNFHRCEDEGT